MTSKIKVDNINKVSDDSNIINKCGTTITLGASGDSINLAAGASQSGFGRSGSVNWQTTPKTTTFTAVDGEGYFVNSGSALTMNLPAGSAGAIVAVSDYARNFNTYNLTVSPNGSEKIGGVADDATLNVDGQAATFVYVDSTKGWINVQNAEDTEQGATFITASGGNQPTPTGCVVDTNYKLHYFTSPGTFCVSAGGGTAAIADYLVVAGGGGGGGTCSGNDSGGGGGGGGFRLANTTGMSTPQTSPLASCSGLPFSPGPYSVSVGGGGAGSSQPSSAKGTSGCASTVSSITSAGGGGGGFGSGPNRPGLDGGSGGGGGGSSATVACGGTGNTPVVSPAQGTDGGGGGGVPINYWGGGGGGAACAGGQGAPPNTGGPGGSGSFAVQTGFAGCNGTTGPVPGARYFAGGGAGGGTPTRPTTGGGTAGDGGGGGGRASDPAGGTNTGGGGGGGDNSGGRNGGSGIVFIRYKFQ